MTGEIKLYGGSAAPSGYLECNGQAISRTTYAGLFGIIGTSFGGGDGSTTFNVPDLRGRVAIGIGEGSGLTNRTLGQLGGEESHVLTTGELPSHSHALNASTSEANQASPADKVLSADGTGSAPLYSGAAPNTSLSSASIGSAGSGNAHNIMQPFVGLMYIIEA